MNKQKLFVDIDDSIFNTIRGYCDTYNYLFEHHKNFKFADWKQVKEWNYVDVCTLNIGHENEIFGSELFFRFAKPLPNAIEVLKELNEVYDVILVSVGVPKNISHKSIWVEKHLPFINNAIYLHNGSDCKADKSIIDMSGGIFIDDHQNNLFSSNADRKICFTNEGRIYKWNQDWKGERVGNWKEIRELLLELGRC